MIVCWISFVFWAIPLFLPEWIMHFYTEDLSIILTSSALGIFIAHIVEFVITFGYLLKIEKIDVIASRIYFFSLSVLIGILTALVIRLISPSVIGFYNITAETVDVTYQLMN